MLMKKAQVCLDCGTNILLSIMKDADKILSTLQRAIMSAMKFYRDDTIRK